MGYWGDRAKDGDSPLDFFGNFKDGRSKNPNSFLRMNMKGAEPHDMFALFGCATLMIENDYEVEKALLTKIYESLNDAAGWAVCSLDQQFYKAYVKDGTILKKKIHMVQFTVNVDAMDTEDAIREATEKVKLSLWNSIIKPQVVTTVNGQVHTETYRER